MTRAAFALLALALVCCGRDNKESKAMKRTLALIVLLAAMGFAVSAGAAMTCSGGVCYESVSATQANSTVTIPAGYGGGFATGAETIAIINDGANEVFLGVNEAATTSMTKINAGEVFQLDGPTAHIAQTLGLICSTGETATVRVVAVQKR